MVGLFLEYIGLRDKLIDVEDEEGSLRRDYDSLLQRHSSKWRRFLPSKRTLQAKAKKLKQKEQQYAAKMEERTTIKNRMGEIERMVVGKNQDLHFQNGKAFDRKTARWRDERKDFSLSEATGFVTALTRLLSLYSVSEDMKLVRITERGTKVLRALEESQLIDRDCLRDRDFEVNLETVSIYKRFVEAPAALRLRLVGSVNAELLVPLLPDLIRSAEKDIDLDTPTGVLSDIESFFASFDYPAAVPYLIQGLGSKAIGPLEEVGMPRVGEKTWTEFFEEGHPYEGQREITVDVVNRTYRLASPVAEGAKTALLKIKDRYPGLASQIESAITEFKNNMPAETHTVTTEENQRQKILSCTRVEDSR